MRKLAGVLAVSIFGMAGAPEARAAGTCTYDGAGTVTAVATAPDSAIANFTVQASGGLNFEGTQCGAATTANTLAVNVDASGRQFRLYLSAPVGNIVFTVSNGGAWTYVQPLTAPAVHWTGGRLADGRWAVELDADGQAELVSASAGLNIIGSQNGDVLSGAGGFKGPGDETAGPLNASATLSGRTGGDTITGPGVFEPEGGNDTLVAAATGETRLRYLGAPQGVHMKSDLSGTETDGDGYGQTDTYTGFAASAFLVVAGSFGDDVLYGGPGPDQLGGNGGADQIFGLGGADFLRGGAGADTIDGGAGDDSVYGHEFGTPGTDVANTVRGGTGKDIIQGGAAGDVFAADDDEADTLTCFGGTDTGRVDRVDKLNADCELAAPTLSFAPASAFVDEGGSTQFTLTLSYPLEVPASVDVMSVDDTATSGTDYTPVARRVTIPAGETTAPVDVAALADDAEEGGETFTLTMANPSNAPALGANAFVAINDRTALVTSVAVGPSPGTGTGGTYLTPPTVVVAAPNASEVRCVMDPAARPLTFADIPAGDCPYNGAGRAATADGAHTLCAASTATTGDTSPVVCASWTTDATAPAVSCAAGSFKVGDRGKVVTATVADAGSGPVVAALSAPAETATSGEKAVTFVARDKAGNANTVKCAYSVSSVALCGQPLVLLTAQIVGRKVELGGLASLAYAGQSVTIRAGSKRVGTARIARDGSFSLKAKAPRGSKRARIRYRAVLADGASTPAHRLSRALVITRRAGNTVHGKVVVRGASLPKHVAFYRQNTCTSKRAFAKAKVTRTGTFKIRLAAPTAPERIALYRVIATFGKGASYTLPIVVTPSAR